jgi:tetratricopeptide (TPR) repeat protein
MRLVWIAALAVAAIPALPVAAQDWSGGTGRMEGKVTGPDGKPIAGATVKLELPQRGGTELTTDKKGKWAILGLMSGTWNVDIQAEGYVPRRLTASVMQEVRIPPIDVKLEKAAPKGPPPEVVAALDKADAAYKAGRFAEARAEYEKLLALRPDLATQIHRQIGFSYIQEKQYATGLDYLLKVLETEPDNVQVRAFAAQAAFEGGKPEKGRELLAALDDTKVDSPDVFFNLGVNLLNAGATEQAVTFFGKAVARDPAYVDGYYQRGLALLQLGKTAEAKADFQKVVELAPGTPQGDLAKKALEQVK